MNPGDTPSASVESPLACSTKIVQFERDRELGYAHLPESFEVFKRYKIDESVYALGHGSYGVVCEAVAAEWGGEKVAIKKMKLTNPGDDELQLQRMKSCWREIKLLAHFAQHDARHILRVKDVMIPLGEEDPDPDVMKQRIRNFDSVYLVLDLYQVSLKHALSILPNVVEYFRAHLTYQILSGLQKVHEAGCVHRDLKPANLLIRNFAPRQCPELCLCDFGSGRKYTMEDEDRTDLNDVTTLWYRSPETLMQRTKGISDLSGIDIWSIGCIMTELLTCNPTTSKLDRKPVFNERNAIMLMHQITGYLADDNQRLVRELKACGATESEVDLICRMLRTDIADRVTASDALCHTWFSKEEFNIAPPCDVSPCAPFHQQCPKDFSSIKEGIWEEAMKTRPELHSYLLKRGIVDK